ncbi:MAG: hypothetical protein NZL83_03520 [Candidatus Absconditabacterales bacterium]|nr:hypothetical protein [Candidatus Absconditabacterales bacterium]
MIIFHPHYADGSRYGKGFVRQMLDIVGEVGRSLNMLTRVRQNYEMYTFGEDDCFGGGCGKLYNEMCVDDKGGEVKMLTNFVMSCFISLKK